MPTSHRSIFLFPSLVGAALCLALGAAGCVADEQLDHADAPDAVSEDGEGALQQVQQPSGPRFRVVELKTSGSGCPPGELIVSATPFNNYSIDWSFNDFGIALEQPGENANISVKECRFQARLQSEQPATYRIERVISQAWAALDPGNSASNFVNAYMQGNPPTTEVRQEQTGPYQGAVTVVGTGSSSRRCASNQWLNVGMRLVLNRTAAGLARVKMVASGWIEIFPSAC